MDRELRAFDIVVILILFVVVCSTIDRYYTRYIQRSRSREFKLYLKWLDTPDGKRYQMENFYHKHAYKAGWDYEERLMFVRLYGSIKGYDRWKRFRKLPGDVLTEEEKQWQENS